MYYLVHLPRRSGYQDFDALNAAGFGAVQALHENTLVVRCPTNRLQQLRNASGADYIVAYSPAWKVAPEFRPLTSAPLGLREGRAMMSSYPPAAVCLFPGEPVAPALAYLAAQGTGVERVTPDRGDGAVIYCTILGRSVDVVTALPGVNWVEPEGRLEAYNDIATGETAISGDTYRGLMNVYTATHHATRPVTGNGQVVGHIDSGVDRGEFGTLWHVDLDGGKVSGSGLQNRLTGIFFADVGYTAGYTNSSAAADAQRFTSTWTGDVAYVTFALARIGGSAYGGSMCARIWTDGGAGPGSTVGGYTSNAVAGSVLAAPSTLYSVTFTFPAGSRPSITRGTNYYVELDYRSVTGISSSAYFYEGYDGYATATSYYRTSGSWTSGGTWYRFVTQIDDATGDDHWVDLMGHGTHTAGTILGAGDGTAKYRGVAYQATLQHRCAGVGASSAISVPDFYAALVDMHNSGARIHSNSWGGGTAGAYSTNAREADRFMWNYPTSLVVCSAGNAGVDSSAPLGKIDPTSVTAPGTAKDILCVGASETYRTSYGDTYSSSSWPNAPINGSYRTRQSDTNGGSTTVYGEGLMAFSSRGPAGDSAGGAGEKRVKPDLVAPGWLFSTRSYYDDNLSGSYTDGTHPGSGYIVMNGTSMACPATAGVAALIRDHLVDYEGIADPSAALVKALLIAGADNLAPGQYQTGSYRELYDNANGTGSPDYAQGYGRVDVARSLGMLDTLDRGWMRTVTSGLTNTTTAKYVTLRAASTTTISAVLVWTDYPAAASANPTITNDLDLQIRTGYTGIKDSGTLAARALLPYNEQDGTGGGTGDDDRNTVEKCVITTPTAGTYYTFEVDAETLTQSPQHFAMVITGDFDTPTPVTVVRFQGRETAAGPGLRWELAEGMDFVGCYVYRGLSPDGPFEKLTSRMVTPDESGVYTFIDERLSLTRGRAYYRIVGVRSNGLLEEQDSPPFAVTVGGGRGQLTAQAWR
jgi:subtilisin family serine protease